jgi:hypothetical protein
MQATNEQLIETNPHEKPSAERTIIRPRSERQLLPVEAIEYYLFRPLASHDRLLDGAYELWRDAWQATLRELEGSTRLHSDEFARQDEIGALVVGRRCIAVTGLRWLDLSLARAREDSYFQHWPAAALDRVGQRRVGISSNTVLHPDWRGTVIDAPSGGSSQTMRLAIATIALSVRRLLASTAAAAIGMARNDRSMNRVASSLGATKLAQIRLHGEETDLVTFERSDVRVDSPVADELWQRRHQG